MDLIVHGEIELRVPRPALWQRRRVGHLEEDGKCRFHTVAFLGVQEESPAALAALEDRRVDRVAQSHVIHIHVPRVLCLLCPGSSSPNRVAHGCASQRGTQCVAILDEVSHESHQLN